MTPRRLNSGPDCDDDGDALADSHATYIVDGEVYIVARGKLWRRTGQTRNPRVMALADAVSSHDGELLTVHFDDGLVLLQHHIAGIEERFDASQRTDYTHVTFEEVETVW